MKKLLLLAAFVLAMTSCQKEEIKYERKLIIETNKVCYVDLTTTFNYLDTLIADSGETTSSSYNFVVSPSFRLQIQNPNEETITKIRIKENNKIILERQYGQGTYIIND